MLSDIPAHLKLLGWRLAVLALAAVVILTAAYQLRPQYTIDIGAADDSSYVQGFHSREISEEFTYRWSTGNSVVLLPASGFPYRVSVSLNGWRPDDRPGTVSLSVNGHHLADIQPTGGFNRYDFEVGGVGLGRGPIAFSIDTQPFSPPGDARSLGVAVDSVTVQPVRSGGLFVIPPVFNVLSFALGVCFLAFAATLLGVPRRFWPLYVLFPLVAAAALLVTPLTLSVSYEPFLMVSFFLVLFTILARGRLYRLIASVYAVLLLLGVAFNAPAAPFLALAGFAIWLCLTTKSEKSDLALVTALSTFAIVPLFLPGVLANSDQPIHLFWVSALDKLVSEGIFYSRWAPDQAYGWGGPIFNFYSPFSWYFVEAFHLLGMGFVQAMKATLAVAIMSGMLGTYLFARLHIKRVGAVVAAVVFGYFPYFIADVHLRGEIGEPIAIGLVPLIFWSFHRLVMDRQPRHLPVASVLLCILMLTHNITSLFTVPFLALYLLFMLVRYHVQFANLRRALGGAGLAALSVVLGMGASAFFWIPAIIEKKYIWGGLPPLSKENPWAFHGYYMPTDWLYSLHIGDLYMENGRHHPIGILYWLTLAAIIGLFIYYRRKSWRTVFPFFALAFPVLALIQVEQAEFFWMNVPLVAFIQMPWRLLFLVMLVSAILIGWAISALYEYMEKRPATSSARAWPHYLPAAGIVSALILLTMLPLQPGFDEREVDYNDRAQNLAHAADMRTRGQFLPVWVDPGSVEPKGLDKPITIEGKKVTIISSGEQSITEAGWKISMKKSGVATFNLNYFPGWQVYSDDKRVDTFPQEGTGRIAARLPAGEQTVRLCLEDTAIQSASEYLSLICFVGIAGVTGLVLLGKPQKKR